MRDGNIISIPRPTSYKDCIALLQSDYYRLTGKVENVCKIWRKSIFNHSVKFHFWFRMASYKGWLYPLSMFRFVMIRSKCHIVMSSKQKVGWGFYTGTTFAIRVNPHTILGNNVNISQISNFGSNCGKTAIIGNNVYIGPMTCIVEDVQIGNDSTIGAGAVVTRDIPSGKTAVGSPAKVIGENKHSSFVNRRWPIEKQ